MNDKCCNHNCNQGRDCHNRNKELTLSPDEIFDIWDEHTDYDGKFVTSVDDFVLAILRKAQEK